MSWHIIQKQTFIGAVEYGYYEHFDKNCKHKGL